MANILISSAGRRVSLLKAFQRELRTFDKDGKVFGSDSKPELSSACHLADNSFKVPRLNEKNYITDLLKICLDNNVKMIIPTIDTELKILSTNKQMFEESGIQIIVSSLNLVTTAGSKILSQSLFEKYGIKYPKIYDKSEPQYPFISKPEYGSSGKDIHVIKSENDLKSDLIYDSKHVFFEYLNPSNYTEFTVDFYFDKNSELKCLVPRERIEIRGGEVSKGATRKNDLYYLLKQKYSRLEGAQGCITMQFFVSKDGDNLYGIECNPRFGGGYPLSYLAGANFPRWLIEEYLFNKKISFFEDWEENLLMLRYDAEVLVHDYKD